MTPGFADPVAEAQTCFRAVLDAMARPGRIQTVGGIAAPAPLCDAAGAVLLTLIDHETPFWLDPDAEAARPWIAFHTGAPANGATFVMALSLPDLDTLPNGTDEMPETGATVILQVAALAEGTSQGSRSALKREGPPSVSFILDGPGLREPAILWVAGLPADFAAIWQRNHALFPRGIDLILCAGKTLTALPRSVTVREA